MAGDPTNAREWAEADAYTAVLGTTAPTDVATAWTTVDPAWAALGLLDGEQGFTEMSSQSVTDTFAWGGILVRSVRSQQKRSVKMVALEGNDTVFSLVNPGSPTPSLAGGLTTRQVYTRQPDKRLFGLELREGTTTLRRYFTGEVMEVGDIVDAEGKVTAYELTVDIYPDGTGLLYTELEG